MKKLIALMLCLTLALGLCACGNSEKEPEPTATPEVTATPESDPEPPVGEAADPTDAPVDPPTEEETNDVAETIALVLSMEGQPIEELYEIIGMPNDSDYTSSCLVDGQDGELHYDGFTVYTVFPTGGIETIYHCE